MGEVANKPKVTKEQAIELLKKSNPRCRSDHIIMYVDSFFDYQEASKNITENGNIVLHPRTGAPIENPYLKIKASAMNALQKLKPVKRVDELWKLVE